MSDKCSVLRGLIKDFGKVRKSEAKVLDDMLQEYYGGKEVAIDGDEYKIGEGWVEALEYAEKRVKDVMKRERCK